MKSFYKKFFIIMIPMALKELINSLVNLIDTIMIGRLGETSIAAVGIANQLYFLFSLFLFGMNCGAGVFGSQFWGKQDLKSMKKVLGLNLILSGAVSILFMSIALFEPKLVFDAFKGSPQVAAEGIDYLKIVCIGYIATAITTAYDMSVCCSERAGLPFVVRVVGLVVNIFMNWVLIFGNLGAPAMGVKGAAIATIIARFTELAVMLSVIYSKKYIQAATPKELFIIPKSLIVKFCKIALPVVLNETAWGLGTTLYSWIFARVSPDAMVIITIVQNIERMMLVFFHGSGNAGGVFIGKAVGAGKKIQAYVYAKKLIYLSLITSAVISVVFIFARPLMLMPYNISSEVYKQSMDILLILSILINIKSLTFLLIVGVFRNGGSTRVSLAIDILSLWLIGIPAVAISGLFFRLPLIVVYSIMSIEEIIKVIASFIVFKRKRWIKSVVELA